MVDVVLTAAVSTLFGASLVWYLIHRPRDFESTEKIPENKPTDSPQSLHKLVEATHGTSGETFFYATVRELARYLSMDAVFIAGVVDARQHSFRSLAYWCNNGYVMNQAISLLHGPDGDASNICYFENSVARLFPNNSLFREPFEAAAFFSVKLQDSSGKLIGILAGLHQSDRQAGDGELDVIRMFAARAAAELERKLALSESLMEKERAQITLHSIGDGVITTDSSGAIDYMNPAAEALTGWRFHQAMGLGMDSVLHLEDEQSGQKIPDPAMHCLSEKRVIAPKTDNVLVSRDGERYSIQGTAAPMIDSEGHCIGVVLVFKDVTDSRRMQKMMVHQATHDPLTGLVNRSEFEDRLEQALVSAKDFENTHALLFLDLDQFKIVNDSAGHVAGDELLKQISVLLAGQLRGRDTLGRLGGDEFSVLLENCPLSKAKKVADMLIEAIREYRFVWDQKTYQVGVSIGIVPIVAETTSRTQLMHDADQACYVAKDQGRGCSYIFSSEASELDQRPGQKLQRQDIESALKEEKFLLMYQPIVALNPSGNSRKTRAELLLRMFDERGEMLKPGAFLPSAARFGLMPEIDRWVIEHVFNRHTHLFVQNPELILNINISSSSLADDAFSGFIKAQFQGSAIKPEQVCFEISETTLGQHLASATRLMNDLRHIGCRFALDDCGLASLSALRTLPVDFVKIDASLIRDLGTDEFTHAMVSSIQSMTRLLGIRTIAEKVDSESQVTILRDMSIDYAQGYYLGDLVSLSLVGNDNPQESDSAFQLN